MCGPLNTKAAGYEDNIGCQGLIEGRFDPTSTPHPDDLTPLSTHTDEDAVAQTGCAELSKGQRECFTLVDRHPRKEDERDLHGFSVAHAPL